MKKKLAFAILLLFIFLFWPAKTAVGYQDEYCPTNSELESCYAGREIKAWRLGGGYRLIKAVLQ